MRRVIPFTKMVGTGNDFIVVDTARHPELKRLSARWAQVSRRVCARHTGVGADGLLVLEPSRTADVRMRVFNPDGSEARMCGNGARCVVRYMVEGGRSKMEGQAKGRGGHVRIETKAGVMEARVRGTRVAMRMPDPAVAGLKTPVRLNGAVYAVDVVDTGVPHAVTFVKDLERTDVAGVGRALRRHAVFRPCGANVDFVQAQGARAIAIRTYERGVEGETMSCGTGVAASAVAHALRRASPGPARIEVTTRSGERLAVSLQVDHRGPAPTVSRLVLEGDARRVFDGTVPWPIV